MVIENTDVDVHNLEKKNSIFNLESYFLIKKYEGKL